MQVTISGINEGKPFTVEQLNVDAMELIEKAQKSGSGLGVRTLVLAALVSSEDLTIRSADPRYMETLQKWAARMKVDDVMKVKDEFWEINKSFFEKGMKAAKQGTPESQAQGMPSASSSDTH